MEVDTIVTWFQTASWILVLFRFRYDCLFSCVEKMCVCHLCQPYTFHSGYVSSYRKRVNLINVSFSCISMIKLYECKIFISRECSARLMVFWHNWLIDYKESGTNRLAFNVRIFKQHSFSFSFFLMHFSKMRKKRTNNDVMMSYNKCLVFSWVSCNRGTYSGYRAWVVALRFWSGIWLLYRLSKITLNHKW